MTRRRGLLLVSCAGVAGLVLLFVLLLRANQTDVQSLRNCHALDHYTQIQEYLVTVSPTLTGNEKNVRVTILENFRDELDCRDQLDPDEIRALVRGT